MQRMLRPRPNKRSTSGQIPPGGVGRGELGRRRDRRDHVDQCAARVDGHEVPLTEVLTAQAPRDLEAGGAHRFMYGVHVVDLDRHQDAGRAEPEPLRHARVVPRDDAELRPAAVRCLQLDVPAAVEDRPEAEERDVELLGRGDVLGADDREDGSDHGAEAAASGRRRVKSPASAAGSPRHASSSAA